MDPKAALERLTSAVECLDVEEAREAWQDLSEWLTNGGFEPQGPGLWPFLNAVGHWVVLAQGTPQERERRGRVYGGDPGALLAEVPSTWVDEHGRTHDRDRIVAALDAARQKMNSHRRKAEDYRRQLTIVEQQRDFLQGQLDKALKRLSVDGD